MKTTILSEEPASIYDIRDAFEDIKKRDKELGFRAAKTEEYLHTFAKLDKKTVEALKKAIEALAIPRLKHEHICKLADILPKDPDEARLVLNSYSITITNENLVKISDVIKEFRK